MIVKLHSQRLQTVDEIRAFLSGSTTFDFELHSRKAYLEKVSGLSRAQVARLIRQYRDTRAAPGSAGPAHQCLSPGAIHPKMWGCW